MEPRAVVVVAGDNEDAPTTSASSAAPRPLPPPLPAAPLLAPQETTLYKERDKADRINLCSCAPPSMRSFHLAWFSFFICFIAWFAPAPLMPVIKQSLHMTKAQVHYSHLASIGSTVLIRFVIGGWVDVCGPKTSLTVLLVFGSLPFFFVRLVQDWTGLVILRAFIGLLGASFVMCQSWTTALFKRQVVGQANALAAGWGNLGGAVTQALMVEIYDGLRTGVGWEEEDAWRLAFVVPGVLLLVTAGMVWYWGTDTPRGDVSQLVREKLIAREAAAAAEQEEEGRGGGGGTKPSPPPSSSSIHTQACLASLRDAVANPYVWVLALHYAVSFGVELVVYNVIATYFHEEFDIAPVAAGRVAAYGGVTNLFARACGGWVSDLAMQRWRMKGRLWVHFVLLVSEAVLLLCFSAATTYRVSVALLLSFSIFTQACSGSCFALVPYLSNQSSGSVSGVVGSGGNMGSVVFTLLFIYGEPSLVQGFRIVGWTVLVASFSVWLLSPERLEFGHRLVDVSMHSNRSLEEMLAEEEEGEEEGEGGRK